MTLLKKILIGVGAVIGLVVVGGGGFVYSKTSAYDASLDKVYDVKVPSIQLSTDPAVLARGNHLAHTIAPCAVSDCHGKDLGGGKSTDIGPIGTLAAPNITSAALGAVYSDGEMARIIEHGVKKDGRGVRFMSSHEFNFIPQEDIVAVISWLRTQPAVNRPSPAMRIGTLGKVLDQLGMIPIDVARRIDHDKIEKAPAPTPTAAYGRFIGKLCTGCHGDNLSGGPIPGAPPEMAIPLNLTPHASGLGGITYEAFQKVMQTGIRRDGRKLDPMMPVEAFGQFDDVEMRALYAYLMSLPGREFGGR
jgi:mono/diheme cytochrome c family protein